MLKIILYYIITIPAWIIIFRYDQNVKDYLLTFIAVITLFCATKFLT